MVEPTPRDAPIRVNAAGDTHIGKREHNEDAVLVRRDLDLYVLADGAGGERGGTIASAVATAAIAHYFEETQQARGSRPAFDELGLSTAARRLSRAVHRANREVVELGRNAEKYRGMGSTVVAAHVECSRSVLHLAWVGDSRAYRVRGGRLEQLTTDHTLLHDVLELVPDLAPERAADLPRKVITRALGMDTTVRVSVASFEVLPGDRYLLCSDGLSDELDEEQLAEALAHDNTAEAETRLLLEVANAAGASDNIAAVVIDCRKMAGADVRRPVRLRGRPAPRASRPGGSPEGSDPEIIIVGQADVGEAIGEDGDGGEERGEERGEDEEDDPELEIVNAPDADEPRTGDEPAFTGDEPALTDDEPALRVVPPESAGSSSVRAVHDLVKPLPAGARPGATERDPTIRFARNCPKCGAEFRGAKTSCPNCWDG